MDVNIASWLAAIKKNVLNKDVLLKLSKYVCWQQVSFKDGLEDLVGEQVDRAVHRPLLVDILGRVVPVQVC